LNQYTTRTAPGFVNVVGLATNTATVTANLQRSVRKGNYFQVTVPVNSTTGAVWQAIEVVAALRGTDTNNPDITTTNKGFVFVPKTPEAFTCDAGGNLTSDGRRTNRWDAENRLVEMQGMTNVPAAARQNLAFDYESGNPTSSALASVFTSPYSCGSIEMVPCVQLNWLQVNESISERLKPQPMASRKIL